MSFHARSRRWAAFGVLSLTAAVVLSACANSPSILEPAGPVALKESGLFWLILGIATTIFVVVTSVLLYSVFRFRARPGSPDARQIHGNTTIEIIWTIVPSVVLFVVLFFTVTTMFALAQPSSSKVINVTAIGHQWWWEFKYPDSKVVSADEMHIPVGYVVRVTLYSDNVIHSFWVPQLAGKWTLYRGMTM